MNRERRRLKKLRKDKLRQLSSTDDPNAKHKHKHKHKCGDELCKHRKHKKRRKHKKHHHRATIAESNPILAPQNANDEEDEQCDYGDSGSGSGSVDSHEPASLVVEKAPEHRKVPNARNVLTKSVNIQLNKLEWPIDDDLISSITEDSSGSSYVSFNQSSFFFASNRNICTDSIIKLNKITFQNPGKGKSTSTEKHSKIAAFLPARQLWAWMGKGYKRATGKGARNKKLFYKTIQRGKETISVCQCKALFCQDTLFN